ncbi:molybdenum cofactor biosynthesis protein B [Bhargavaea ullalensis]|uniref:Molybdenum cofactor biosynthesis protein B n=1 Tax=Bhargavaea ullalensis TaxID=1265685 RepID=A0ABV2G7A5_9BACL
MAHGKETEGPLGIAVLTISDTRTEAEDTAGALIVRLAEEAGHRITERGWVRDDPDEIRDMLSGWFPNDEVDAVITTGGTGIAARDITLEAIRPMFSKEIDGFGELFRYLSFAEDVGTKALLSRAAAGVSSDKAIFVLPGSRGAVRLAMERLILPELRHITAELRKDR